MKKSVVAFYHLIYNVIFAARIAEMERQKAEEERLAQQIRQKMQDEIARCEDENREVIDIGVVTCGNFITQMGAQMLHDAIVGGNTARIAELEERLAFS